MRDEYPQYWFKRKRFGWGWVPVTWQGWVVTLAFVVALIVAAAQLPTQPQKPTWEQIFRFVIIAVPSVTGFFAIAYAKAPHPRWRWGRRAGDDPDEDF